MRVMKIVTTGLAAIAVASGCAACQKVRYADPRRVEVLTADFGSTDLQTLADRMVGSLVRHPGIASGRRPVVQVSKVRNRTSEHIDTKSVTDKIRTSLVKSGRVRFTAVSDVNREMLDNLEYQSASGVVDPRTAHRVGRQIGADYLLFGDIASIVKRAGRETDVYYKLTLNLVDVETGIIEWTDEQEIRKQATRPIIGG